MRADPISTADLTLALDTAEPLLSGRRRAAVAQLRTRLVANQFRVLVVGDAKRGKSTLVNALVGRDILPTGVLPVTALVTTLVGGPLEAVTVSFDTQRRERHPLDMLGSFVTEDGNPHNRKGVTAVTVTLDAPLLRDQLQLVDTPGTGSVFEHNTRSAEQGLDDIDAAIIVLTADPPMSAAEARLLTMVHRRAQFVLVVLNKIDYLSPRDARLVHEFTADNAAKLVGSPIEVFDCSAARALAARLADDRDGLRASGLSRFETAFCEQVLEHREQALPASIANHTARLVTAELDEVVLRLRVLLGRTADEQRLVAEFRHSLDAVLEQQDELQASLQARRRLFSQQLSERAEQFRMRLGKEATASLDEFVHDDRQAATRPRQLERAGHTRVATLIRAAIEGWRDEQESATEAQLAKLAEKIAGDVNHALDRVREAARSLLQVDLSLTYAPPPVPESTRFHFDFSEDAGPTELLAGALRQCLPGRIGRRHAVRWLDRDRCDLADRHVGRARADLDDRFRTACTELANQSAGELAAIIDALRNAVDRASAIAGNDHARDEEQAVLGRTAEALRGLYQKLTAPLPATVVASQPGRVP